MGDRNMSDSCPAYDEVVKQFPLKCRHCGEEVANSTDENRHAKICKKRPVPCPLIEDRRSECSRIIPFDKLRAHLSGEQNTFHSWLEVKSKVELYQRESPDYPSYPRLRPMQSSDGRLYFFVIDEADYRFRYSFSYYQLLLSALHSFSWTNYYWQPEGLLTQW